MTYEDDYTEEPEGIDQRVLIGVSVVGVIIIIIAAFFLLSQNTGNSELTVKIENAESQGLWKAQVKIIGLEETLSVTTDRFGRATFLDIPQGQEIKIEASGSGFEKAVKNITLTQENETITLKLIANLDNQAHIKTITFVGPSGIRLDGELITVDLSCSTGMLLDEPIQYVSTGFLDVEVPSGCGTLLANVSATGYESGNYSLDETQIIRLQELITEEGTIKATVEDSNGRFLDNIEVSISDSYGVSTGFREFTSFGEVKFSLEPGSYKAFAFDPAAKYADAEQIFSISPNSQTKISLIMDEISLGSIKAKAVSKSSGAEIINALITIENPSGEKISQEFKEEFVEFPITEKGTYTLVATAEGFIISAEIEVNSDNANGIYELELAPCTPSTCGLLKIIVKDEDDIPVSNVRVGLTDPETGFFLQEYGLKYTNGEGIVNFTGLESGTYAIIAQKYPAEGTSDSFKMSQDTDTEIEVELVIGEGTIIVEAVDSQGKAIPFGFAEFLGSDGKSFGRLPLDSEGKGTLVTKADKKVYVRVESEGYTNYTSRLFQVYPNEINTINAKMQKEILGDSPKIEFVGMFNETNSPVKGLSAGKTFKARFKVSIPTESDYEQVGVFLRVGEENLVEKDDIYIEKINAPTTSVMKGATYTPPTGEEEDESNLTNNEAKWATAVWDETVQGIYDVEMEIVVRDSTTPAKYLPIFYRVYAINGNGEVLRDPFDSELGTGEETPLKQALYAETYEKGYNENAIEECFEDFCYSERVLDIQEGLFIHSPFDVRIFGNYQLDFSITNNSKRIHDNAEIRIMNSSNGVFPEENLKILSYSIVNSDSQEFSSGNETFELPSFALGDFRQNKTINARFDLRPEELGNTALLVQIVSDNQLVFEKFISFNSVSREDLKVTVFPEVLPAFTEFDLNVNVMLIDKDDDFEAVNDAMVRVERITPDREETVFISSTNGDGLALIRIPPSDPKTRVKIRVEKEGYAAKTVKLKVSDEILEFDPEKLDSTLDLTNNNDEKLSLKIKNLVPVTLHLTKSNFSINSLGLLDELRMNNFLAQYVDNSQLPYQKSSEVKLLTAISEDARLLDSVKELKGSVFFEVSNAGETIFWPMEVPINITINLAEPPKNPGCIEVSLKEWKAATISGKAQTEFQITNNCLNQNNEPLDLRNLQAKIDWKSNKFGNVELIVTDPETGQEAQAVLIEELYSIMFDLFPGGAQYNGLLVFTPKGGTSGEKAKFSVIIDAGQITNSGEQLAGSSNDIQGEIDIIDLAQCIQYTPDAEAGVILQPTEQEGTLGIDISNCGNVTADFWLCKEDTGCSGGVEGQIIVQPDKFTLNSSNSTKTVLIGRQPISGMYGIDVQVRTPGSNYHSVGLVDVLVKPRPEDAFELSKYEFVTIGIGSKDSAELTNRYLSETVTVDASICDWGDAEREEEKKDSWFDWKNAGIGAAIGALSGLNKARDAQKAAANKEALLSSDALDQAKEETKNTQATDEVTKGEHEALCKTLKTNVTAANSASSACSGTVGASATSSAKTKITSAKTQCETMNKDLENLAASDDKSVLSTAAGTNANTGENLLGNVLSNFDLTNSKVLETLTKNTTGMATGLEAAAASYETAAAQAAAQCSATQPQACSCASAIQNALPPTNASITDLKAYSKQALADSKDALETVTDSVGNAKDSIGDSFDKIEPLTKSSSGAGKFASVLATNALTGFLLGGLTGGLFGEDKEDVCLQRRIADLPDYVINVLDDLRGIDSETRKFGYQLDKSSAQVIGEYDLQKVGMVVTNRNEENPKPVFDTATFNATQHLHADPTEIEKGTSNFGPFNVPDSETQQIAQKIHMKFKTQEAVETIPDLSFDTLSCVSGSKIGRTGTGALPKVSLNWSFSSNGITRDACLEENPDAIYCDATQFSIMLSKRMHSLKEFFDANPALECPHNPYADTLDNMSELLEISSQDFLPEECYIPTTEGMLEGRPAIMQYLDSMVINSTQEIKSSAEFEKTIHFNALLMRDAFSDDFQKDFAKHYSDERFFDTPDWFYGLALDSDGESYGLAKLYEEGRINFTNRFFESNALSSAGLYDIILSIRSDSDSYNFFNSDGSPNVWIDVEFQLLQEPNPNSAFYSMPFDGLVGLQGNSFSRNGYGISFDNETTANLITINNDPQPAKTYSDAGSNPVVFASSSFENSFYALNTSASERGNLLQLEKVSSTGAYLKFSPSKATPLLLKISADEVSDDDLSAFYLVTARDVPIDTGATMTFWEGAGACLDPSGVIITETFDQKPDRAAASTDPVVNWQSAYAVDFGEVIYTGDVYLRTIIYTDPLSISSIKAEHPANKMDFLTPDAIGQEVQLGGVGGIPYNSVSGGSTGNINSVEDVFELVETEMVCVVDSGRKANFFWNPKAIYEMTGSQRNVSEFTNSLTAGDTCIGFGGIK
ncbi:MAG: carboxypeptidase-like regulatory domain-containing protein [Candidatus Diapherotrites archaeon]